jgi:hypothetical protein
MNRNLICFLAAAAAVCAASSACAQWPASIVGTNPNWTDLPAGIANDVSGNVVVCSTIGVTGQGPKINVSKYSSIGLLLWSTSYTGPTHSDLASAMKLDAEGNVCVVGISVGTTTGEDILTLKIGANGVFQWARRYNSLGSQNDEGICITPDIFGDVIVSGKIVLGDGTSDIETIEYTPDGTMAWQKRYSGALGHSDEPVGLATDAAGTIYLAGWSDGIFTRADFVTLKYDRFGVLQWSRKFNDPGSQDDKPVSIAFDSVTGSIVVAGNAIYTDSDFYIIEYRDDGSKRWSNRFDWSGDDVLTKMTVDHAGNVICVGHTGTDFELQNYAITKYNSDGVRQFRRSWSGNNLTGGSTDGATDVAVDATDNIYVAGTEQNYDGIHFFFKFGILKISPTNTLLSVQKFDLSQANDQFAYYISVFGTDAFVAGNTPVNHAVTVMKF